MKYQTWLNQATLTWNWATNDILSIISLLYISLYVSIIYSDTSKNKTYDENYDNVHKLKWQHFDILS